MMSPSILKMNKQIYTYTNNDKPIINYNKALRCVTHITLT